LHYSYQIIHRIIVYPYFYFLNEYSKKIFCSTHFNEHTACPEKTDLSTIGDNIISAYSKRRSKGNDQFGNVEVAPTPSASVQTLGFLARAAKAMPFEDEDENCGSTFTNKVDDEDDDLFLISSTLKKKGSRLVGAKRSRKLKDNKPRGHKSALPESAQLKDDEASSTDDSSDHGKNVNLSGDEKTLQDSTDDHEEANSETTAAVVETTALSSNVV
jgi:hypothetical protein